MQTCKANRYQQGRRGCQKVDILSEHTFQRQLIHYIQYLFTHSKFYSLIIDGFHLILLCVSNEKLAGILSIVFSIPQSNMRAYTSPLNQSCFIFSFC